MKGSEAPRSKLWGIRAEASDYRDTEPMRFTRRGIAVRLFLTCWIVFVLHFATNIVREFYPALTLGDHFSFDVSEYLGLHPDLFEIPGRGSYINNNPGASIIGAIPYAVARPMIDFVTRKVQAKRAVSKDWQPPEYQTPYPKRKAFYGQVAEKGWDVKFVLAAGVMQAFAMAPISALSAVFMFYVLVHLTGSSRKALFLSLLYAFATPVFYRTAIINHNILLAHFAFFSFVLLWRPWDNPDQPRRPWYFTAGLLCGWTLVLDYSGVIAVLVLGIYALARYWLLPNSGKRPTDLVHFGLGIALCIGFLMAYQWLCFGNPIYPAQHHMPLDQHNYTEMGYVGFDWPHLDLLWMTAFDMRFGLFTFAPLLLLALYLPGWIGKNSLVPRLEVWIIGLFCAAFFIFCAANQFGRITWNTGVRHIVPVVPFIFLAAAAVLIRLPRVVAVLFGIATTYWSWCLAMYREVDRGIQEALTKITFEGLRFPWMTRLKTLGYVDSISALPILLLLAGLLFVIWSRGASAREIITPALPRSQTIQE